jgi:hypothetical protein
MKLGEPCFGKIQPIITMTVIDGLPLVRVFQRLDMVKSRHSCSGHPEWQNRPHPLHSITHTDTVDIHH